MKGGKRMGILYDVPVVTGTTLLSNGFKIGTRNVNGNDVVIGSSVSGSKVAFFNSDDIIYNYNSNIPLGSYGAIVWNANLFDLIIYVGSYDTSAINYVSAVDRDWIKPPYTTMISQYLNIGTVYQDEITLLSSLDKYATSSLAANALGLRFPQSQYPITYHYTNSTVSGPSEAAVGDTVTVSAVPDVGYGITDASTQILVTNNDVAVPYTWDAANQRITFTMPDPS